MPPSVNVPFRRLTHDNIDTIGSQIIQELKDSGMQEQIDLAHDLEQAPLSQIWEDKNNNGAIDLTNEQGDVVLSEFSDKSVKDKTVLGEWAAVLMGYAYLNMDWRDGSPSEPVVGYPKNANKVTVFSAYDWALREQQRASKDSSGDYVMWNGLHIYVDYKPSDSKVYWALSIEGSQDSEMTKDGRNPGFRHQNEHGFMRQPIDGLSLDDYMKKVKAGRGQDIFTTRKQIFFSFWCPEDALGGMMRFFGRSLTTPVPITAIHKETEVVLKELARRDGNAVSRVIPEEAIRRAFPPGHAEGFPSGGASKDIETADPKQILLDQFDLLRTPYRMFIHVKGNITREQVIQAINNPENPFYHLVPQLPARNRPHLSVPGKWTPSYVTLENMNNKVTVGQKVWRTPPASWIKNPAALEIGFELMNQWLKDQFVGQGIDEVKFEYKTATMTASNAVILLSVSGDGKKVKEVLQEVPKAIRQLLKGPGKSAKQQEAWEFGFNSIREALNSKYQRLSSEDQLFGDQAIEANGRKENERLLAYSSVKWDDVVEMVGQYLDLPATVTMIVRGKNDKEPWSSDQLKKIDQDLKKASIPSREVFGPPKYLRQNLPADFKVESVLKSRTPQILPYNRVRYELTNGVVVILVKSQKPKKDNSAAITLSAPFSNPPGKQGYTRLVGENLLRSPGIPKESVAAELASLGAEYKISTGRKDLQLSLNMPPDKVDAVTHFIFHVMDNPTRNDADLNSGDNKKNFQETKDILEYKIKKLADDLPFMASYGLEEYLGVKRGDLEFGTPADLRNITPEDLRNGHLRFVKNPKMLQVTVAGISDDPADPQMKALFYELAQIHEERTIGTVSAAIKPGDNKYPYELERIPYVDPAHVGKWDRPHNVQAYYTKFEVPDPKDPLQKALAGDRISHVIEYMKGPLPTDPDYPIFYLATRMIIDALRKDAVGYIRWVRLRGSATENDPAMLFYEFEEVSKKIDGVLAWYPPRILRAIDELTRDKIRLFALDNRNKLDKNTEEPKGRVEMSLAMDDPVTAPLHEYKVYDDLAKLSDADLDKRLEEVKKRLRQYVDPKNPNYRSVIHIVGARPAEEKKESPKK